MTHTLVYSLKCIQRLDKFTTIAKNMTESLEEQLDTANNERLKIVQKYLEKNHKNINEWVSWNGLNHYSSAKLLIHH